MVDKSKVGPPEEKLREVNKAPLTIPTATIRNQGHPSLIRSRVTPAERNPTTVARKVGSQTQGSLERYYPHNRSAEGYHEKQVLDAKEVREDVLR